MGLPVKRSLPLVVDKLVEYGLRDRIRVICSGKMINPGRCVAAALCLGAGLRKLWPEASCSRSAVFRHYNAIKTPAPQASLRMMRDLQKGLDATDKAARVAKYAQKSYARGRSYFPFLWRG